MTKQFNTIKTLSKLGVAAALFMAGTPLFAQFSPGQGTGMNAAMLKLFGDTTAFTSKADLRVLDKSQAETAQLPMNFILLDGKMRAEVDVMQIKSKDMPAGATATLKQMGMDNMVAITRPDRKVTLLVYPGLKSYAETPMTKEESADAEKDYKLQKEKLGKETIDGHPCEKAKITMTSDKGDKHEATVWDATDMKNFPVKMQMTEGDNTIIMQFKEVKLGKPDAKLFEAPDGFTKYDSPEKLATAAMTKMLGAGGK